MRRVLDFERLTPPPGSDADSVTHEFATRVDHDGGPAMLEVHGVATMWDLLVDGDVVASGRSMFEPRSVDLDTLTPGAHEVRVRVHPLTDLLDAAPRRPRARWRTMLADEPRLRWARTTILGRAPGFAPGPPVVGPYRPVVLRTPDPTQVDTLSLVATVDAAGTGVLQVDAAVRGAVAIEVLVSGPTGLTEVLAPVVDGRIDTRVELPEVARWWPHTHGHPHLYDVQLRHEGLLLELPGDATTATDVRRVGFRSLGNDRPGSLALRVNDVGVFVRGAVWTPGDLAALDQAVALGLNLIRVSGLSPYESDAFHARCDELGLLAWQDLALVTFDYPLADGEFRAVLSAEVATQSARLVGHPSTVVVCGSAEHEQQAAMFGVPVAGEAATGAAGELAALTRPIVAASGLDAIWVDSSPTGGVPPTRVDTGIAQYFGVGGYRRHLSDARTAGVLFAAECLAFSHLPDGPWTDAGVPGDNGADWDFADVRRHYLRERYGETATLEQEQRVTGEVMADVYGEWRRPASPCAGGIMLWLRDLAPGAGWGLLDDAGRPKPAARVLAPVLAPTAVWILDEGLNGLDVHIAHDPPDPVELCLRVELRRADGMVLDAAENLWTMPGHGHRVVGVEQLLGRFADVSHAYRFGPAAHAEVVALLTQVGPAPLPERTATWRLPAP